MDQRTRKLMTMYKHYIPEMTLTDIEKCGEGLITAISNNTNNTKTNRTRITRKQKWEEKPLYGRFILEISNISHEKTWMP